MAFRESGGSRILLCLGVFVFATSLCHCTTLSRLKTLDKVTGDTMLKKSHQPHGRLLIGKNSLQGAKINGTKATKNVQNVESDYQADMGWKESRQPHRQADGQKSDIAAVERLLKMEPKVECTGDSMKLQVQDAASTPGSFFFVDRGNHLPPLPLSKLPPSCGYTIRSTRRDLVLVAPYDGCFVILEDDNYVLPLRWWGLPVRMSCPLIGQLSPNPPMVTCHADGMVVKTEWTIPTSKIKVNLDGNWEPLMAASLRCGFSIVVHPEGVVISVQYAPCLERKDGLYTLELVGEGEAKISCPSLLAAQPAFTKPAEGPPHHSASTPSLDPFPNPAKLAAPQLPGLPQKPEVPNNEPYREPRNIEPPQLSYYSFYPSYFYTYPAGPEETPSVQSQKPIPPVSSPAAQTAQDQRQQHLHLFPFYSQPPTYTQPPVAKPSPRKLDEHLLPTPFNLAPGLQPVEPPASQPEAREQKALNPFNFNPQGPAYEALHAESPLHQLYLESLSGPPQPTACAKTQGQGENEAPQTEVYQPSYPQPKPATKSAAVSQPSEPEAPQKQVYQPSFPYPFYTQPKPGIQPATKTAAVPHPSQPEAAQGQVHQPAYLYPQPEPEKQPAKNPTATPTGRDHKPCHSTQIPCAETNDDKAPIEKPVQPPAMTPPPPGQMRHLFHYYYYYLPHPQPVILPTATLVQQQVTAKAGDQKSPKSAVPQTSSGDIVPQGPQLTGPFMHTVYCPQSCPPEFSNCCPQFAFHQHLHIVPAGLGTVDAPPFYPGVPFLSSVAFSEFGLHSALLPQKPPEGSTSEPISPQTLSSGNKKDPYLRPPDGNPAAPPGNNSSKTATPEQPVYPYFVPNLQYPHWSYRPQNEELQSQSITYNNEPSKPPPSVDESVIPVMQYDPYNIQSPVHQTDQPSAKNTNSPLVPNFMSYISQYAPQQHTANQQNTPTAHERQSFNMKSFESEGPTHLKIQRELDRFLVPYHMLQDSPVSTYNKSAVPNNSKQHPFVNVSKNSTKHEQTLNSYSEPKSFVLLQRGPPSREPNSFNDSPMPLNDLVHDAHSDAHNLARHHSSKAQNRQNLKPLQEQTQHPKWLGEGTSNPLSITVNYMQRLDKESGLPLFSLAMEDRHFMLSPNDPSSSAAPFKPKFPESFKDIGKSLTPLGSSQRFPPHVPERRLNDGALELATRQKD